MRPISEWAWKATCRPVTKRCWEDCVCWWFESIIAHALREKGRGSTGVAFELSIHRPAHLFTFGPHGVMFCDWLL